MRLLTVIAVAMVLVTPGGAFAQGGAGAPPPEDPAVLSDLAQMITIGGQIRMRYELRRPIGYYDIPPGGFVNDHQVDIVSMRTRIHTGVKVAKNVDAFIQIQDSRLWGDEEGVISDDQSLDLHQAWVEHRNFLTDILTLKVGRQELMYGDQRLISPLDWSNVGRAWDAIKIHATPMEGFWVDGFVSIIPDVVPPATTGTGSSDRTFNGIYGSFTQAEPLVLDVYVLNRRYADRNFVAEDGNVSDLNDVTWGVRGATTMNGFHAGAEGVIQMGHRSTDRVFAHAFAVETGYEMRDMDGLEAVGAEVEFTYGSGDNRPTDGDTETFDPLFPFGHFYQGHLDLFSWSNGQDLKAEVYVKPDERWKIAAAVHKLWLTERKDAWYDAGGNAIRRDPTGSGGKDIGVETDLYAQVKATEYMNFWFGWSHFFPGYYVRNTGGRDIDMDWLFLQAVLNF